MKVQELFEAAELSPSALRNAIKKHLKSQRFHPASEEKTEGALKVWFDVLNTKMVSMKGIAALLKKHLPEQNVKFVGGKVVGDGFNLELEEGGDGLYLAVFNKGAAGDHHRMGVDN